MAAKKTPATPLAESADDMGAKKEMKVLLPVSYHTKLHTIKVLRGQGLSETVRVALDIYFERMAPLPRIA